MVTAFALGDAERVDRRAVREVLAKGVVFAESR